jgi:cyclohexanone monooxygenase
MLRRCRQLGLRARVFEQGNGVGGTWFWNRYPGARCDVESMQYSYQFSDDLQQDWNWTERYSGQPEILRYLNHVADRFDLRGDIQLETRVESAVFDEARSLWTVTTNQGDRVSAQFCVMATGCLSSFNLPKFKGLGQFAGTVIHTGQWPQEPVSFKGQRVGVIGTGSSAIQAIPLIAQEAKELTVFQRTPNYSVPAANHPLSEQTQREVKDRYAELRETCWNLSFGFYAEIGGKRAMEVTPEERIAEYERRWKVGGLGFLYAYTDLLFDPKANETAAEFMRGKIREIVKDPATAELLCPHTVVGCKRLCSDTNYYETYNRSNVKLVDVSKAPIDEITAKGLITGGREYEFDVLIFATGFDAMTGALLSVDIRGRDGIPLKQKWAAGPRTYLGLGTAGFPNLFLITGPGSPSVLSNMVPSVEHHSNWIAECIDYLRREDLATIEADLSAENTWVEHVNQVANATLYPHCNSWYLGANVPGKPRVFMPYIGVPPYVAKCAEVAAKGYEGFVLEPAAESASA